MGPVPRLLDFEEVGVVATAAVVVADEAEDVDAEVGAPVAVVVRVGIASTGKDSSGENSIVAF